MGLLCLGRQLAKGSKGPRTKYPFYSFTCTILPSLSPARLRTRAEFLDPCQSSGLEPVGGRAGPPFCCEGPCVSTCGALLPSPSPPCVPVPFTPPVRATGAKTDTGQRPVQAWSWDQQGRKFLCPKHPEWGLEGAGWAQPEACSPLATWEGLDWTRAGPSKAWAPDPSLQ